MSIKSFVETGPSAAKVVAATEKKANALMDKVRKEGGVIKECVYTHSFFNPHPFTGEEVHHFHIVTISYELPSDTEGGES